MLDLLKNALPFIPFCVTGHSGTRPNYIRIVETVATISVILFFMNKQLGALEDEFKKLNDRMTVVEISRSGRMQKLDAEISGIQQAKKDHEERLRLIEKAKR